MCARASKRYNDTDDANRKRIKRVNVCATSSTYDHNHTFVFGKLEITQTHTQSHEHKGELSAKLKYEVVSQSQISLLF